MWSEAELTFDANIKFTDNVRAMSGGRLNIEAFSSGALMPYTEYFDAVRGGVVELSQTGGTYWSGKDPALAAVDLASIFLGSYPKMLVWMWEAGGIELAREAYAKWDLYYIGHHMYTWAGESIVSKVPIRTKADIKGLKIRAPETMAPVWDALGADVLTIPGAEVYTALSTGLVEASDWSSPAANMRLGYAEICPYYSKPGDYYMGGTGDLFTTLETWNSLPDDLKAILEQAARVQALDMWTMTSWDDFTAVGLLAEQGAEMIPWDAALVDEMQALIRDVNKDLVLESEGGKKIWDSYEKFLALTKGI